MALTLQDLQRSAWSVITGATDDDILSAVNCRIMAIIVHHTATATLSIDDAATYSAADFSVRCLANDSGILYLGPNGIRISTGLSTSLSAGVGFIFYVSDPE